MDSTELRNKFIEFFKEKGHSVIPSASLVPNDPTEANRTLFTTAGMQQFKRYYSKPDEAPYTCVTSCQKCIRTGDIEEVGDDTHLTFFEMLGNFSFGYPTKAGSYFKEQAIKMAWEFLTEELNFDKKRIHATYFKEDNFVPTDEESLKILEGIDGLEKIVPQGFEDNFWSLGTEGSPGGPTVEFYVDGIEVWNLVFNEFVMQNGKYEPAEYKGVDTGMGLERLLTTLNGNDNVYETDLFEPIIRKIEELSGKKYSEYPTEFRIVADHIKTAVFAISDGVLPSNKDAGYVVRRLIRRAIVKANQIGIKKDFTSQLAEKIFDIYGSAYFGSHSEQSEESQSDGILRFTQDDIKKELQKEENKFRQGLVTALKQFDHYYANYLNRQGKDHISPIIGAKFAFDMFQSYGFPIEMTIEEFNNRKMLMIEGAIKQDFNKQFNEELKKHQELSRTASAGMFKGGLADAGEEAVKYHTATHLLHQALRQVLGEHVQQKGSNITADRMRFDFTHPDKMTPEQIKEVEDIVNEKIKEDLPVTMEEMSPEEAKKSGALGFFEHKYGDKVKVYSIGGFSKEICGGPHIKHTGELEHFKIQKEESSSAGVRRIKAVLE